MIVPTLPNLNLSLTSVFKANAGLICKLGNPQENTQWGNVASDLKNGNSFLIERGGTTQSIVVREGGWFYATQGGAFLGLNLGADKNITSVLTPPVGARSSGTNFFFSEATFYSETLVLLANKFNHIYPIQVGLDTVFGVIATDSDTAPDSLVPTDITADPTQTAIENPRQAYCEVDALGKVISLVTFPRMANPFVTISPSSGPNSISWSKTSVGYENNALQTEFEFLAGTGTGEIGEVGIFAGSDLVAYKAINPQLLKDLDVDLTVIWNLIIGAPEIFI